MATINTNGNNKTNTESTMRGVQERNRAFVDAQRNRDSLFNRGSVGGTSVIRAETEGMRQRVAERNRAFRQGRTPQ